MFSKISSNRMLVVLLIGFLAVGLTGCATVASAGGGPSVPLANEALPHTITVNGIGTASASPDLAYIQLGVESISTNASEAVSDNIERMTAVMDALKTLKIADENIQTLGFNMWLEQVTDKEGLFTGELRYHVSNQVNVKLTDVTQAGELLQKALAAGANSVSGINFALSDPAALQVEARDKAIAEAKARAEQLARGLGIEIAGVRQVTEFSVGYTPVTRADYGMGVGGGGGTVVVYGGQYSVSVEIQVIFDIAE